MGGEMPDETAACLYAGLVTDTGRFQYEATTPATLRIAAALREHPFDHARMVQALYEDNRREYLQVEAVALARATVETDADLVWTYLTQADLADAGVGPDETDDLIDLIRTVRDVDVAAVLKQRPDGRFKVSTAVARGARPRRDRRHLRRRRAPAGGRLHLGARPGGHDRAARRRAASARARLVTGPEGLLLVDKPGGMTSHDVVDVDPQDARHPQGGPRGNARSHGDRPAHPGRRPRDTAAALPGRAPQDVRGHGSVGRGDHDA